MQRELYDIDKIVCRIRNDLSDLDNLDKIEAHAHGMLKSIVAKIWELIDKLSVIPRFDSKAVL